MDGLYKILRILFPWFWYTCEFTPYDTLEADIQAKRSYGENNTVNQTLHFSFYLRRYGSCLPVDRKTS